MYFVYKVSNTVNDKLYIGITKNIRNRWCLHRGDAIKRNVQKPLYQDMRLYGVNQFSIEQIDQCLDKDAAYNREIAWMRWLDTVYPHGYNLQSSLTLTEKAIIKFNILDWPTWRYAEFHGRTIDTIEQIKRGDNGGYVTRNHLPKNLEEVKRYFTASVGHEPTRYGRRKNKG